MATNSILVIGGGFSGMTAALEVAEMGYEVYLVEKSPFLGGRVAQLNKYFPKLCPPSCGLEIQFQRIRKNPNIKILTMAEIISVKGDIGNYNVNINITPRYTSSASVDFSKEADSLRTEAVNDYEFGLSSRKSLYIDAPFAFPHRYVLEVNNLSNTERKTLEKCKSINFEEKAREIQIVVASIVVATGWKPYDVSKLTNLGAGKFKNCITNMQMERLASAYGPTNGVVLRPEDEKRPKRIAFVQCAGSRDENHLSYCSYVCCMASLKQAMYIREQNPEAEIVIYYIDLRTPGRYEDFKNKILADQKIKTVKGKVAEIVENPNTKDIWLTVEDTLTGNKSVESYDLVVLATGMQPTLSEIPLPLDVKLDEEGFIISGEEKGIFVTGCAKSPIDVMKSAQSATGAAMRAIQTMRGGN